MGQASDVERTCNCKVPSKIDCDLFVFLGTSLINGFATSTVGMDSELLSYYFPGGDQSYCERFGTTAQGYGTPTLNKGQTLYLNKDYNYAAGSSRFGCDSLMAVEYNSNYNWNRDFFFFHYEQNGASIISGETTPSWNINDSSTYDDMIENIARCVNSLKSRGYNPRISVMWGSAAVTSTTASAYVTSINELISGIRTNLSDTTINFYWGKPVGSDAAQNAYRSGLDTVAGSDSYVELFDYEDIELGGDGIHPTTMAMMDLALMFCGYWNEKYNSQTRPTVTSPAITGTLQNGQAIGFTYTFDGEIEDTTIVADTLRLRDGTGTRCEFYSADDASGTNEDYMALARNKTETTSLNITHIGKYIQVRIFPKQTTDSLHGDPIKGSWEGPVIA